MNWFIPHRDMRVSLDSDDEIIRETLLTRDGEIINPRVRELVAATESVQ